MRLFKALKCTLCISKVNLSIHAVIVLFRIQYYVFYVEQPSLLQWVYSCEFIYDEVLTVLMFQAKLFTLHQEEGDPLYKWVDTDITSSAEVRVPEATGDAWRYDPRGVVRLSPL